MATGKRADLRKRYLERIRKGRQLAPRPLVYHRGATFDRIIFEWIRDIEKAQEALGKALELISRMKETDWEKDNLRYAATCKWIQSGLDSIQQWDIESGKSASLIASLPWKDLRVFRNNLSHAFQDMLPKEIKQVAEDNLPNLKLLLNLIYLSRQTIKRGDTQHIPVPNLDHLKKHLHPLTIEEGTHIGKVGTSLIYIGYDERYYPRHVHLSGYQEDGVVWTATPYNDLDGEPEGSIMIPGLPGKPMLWTPWVGSP